MATGSSDETLSSASSASEKDLKRRSKDLLIRNALRCTISSREYELLHRYTLAKCSTAVKRRLPTPSRYRKMIGPGDDSTAAAVRASLRVFVISQAGLRLWEYLQRRFMIKGRSQGSKTKQSSTFLRLSVSLSSILLLHRLLYRFFTRLRSNLLARDAAPFRRRNPRTSQALTSHLAPAIGASLAGFTLGVYPADQLRITLAIYAATRSLEFCYNLLDAKDWFKNKPKWFGSWLLMPLATGQLLHAFVFDRDCFPAAYGKFILDHTPNYIQRRPQDYPAALPWPSTHTIIDSLAEMSRLKWPPFVSPILFPKTASPLPDTLTHLAPITSPAHPAHTSLSCATLHPSDPSCTRTLATYILNAFPTLAKFFAAFYTLLSLPALLRGRPRLGTILTKTIRTSTFLTLAIGTAWSSICFLQPPTLPRTFAPSARFFFGGALAGLWAYVDRGDVGGSGRAQVMYSTRMSIDSLWKVGKKRRWWTGLKGGDVLVFVAGLGGMNVIYELQKRRHDEIGSDVLIVDKSVGKVLQFLRGVDDQAESKRKSL